MRRRDRADGAAAPLAAAVQRGDEFLSAGAEGANNLVRREREIKALGAQTRLWARRCGGRLNWRIRILSHFRSRNPNPRNPARQEYLLPPAPPGRSTLPRGMLLVVCAA